MRALFEGFGVRVLDGGPTLNPSTYDLLAAIHAVPAEQVIVLPNSANVVMAAERAAELSDKTVTVVPSRLAAGRARGRGRASIPAARPPPTRRTMLETLARVRTGAVAPAARDDVQGRFRTGDAVGFVDDEIIAWGEPRETLGRRARAAQPATPSWSPACAAPMRRSTMTRSIRSLPTGSSSSCRSAGSRATGGCSALSSRPVGPVGADRRAGHHRETMTPTAFASSRPARGGAARGRSGALPAAGSPGRAAEGRRGQGGPGGERARTRDGRRSARASAARPPRGARRRPTRPRGGRDRGRAGAQRSRRDRSAAAACVRSSRRPSPMTRVR